MSSNKRRVEFSHIHDISAYSCEVDVTLLFSAGCRSGFFGTVVEYGAERKISRHSILGATVSVGVPQGVSLKIK